MPNRRSHPYYVVAGIDLRGELSRLRHLPVFADGLLARAEPELKVRRARRRPNRVGFAIPAEFRLSVTSYPGIGPGDALETLLHELVHLHVGRAREARAWHGRDLQGGARPRDGGGLRRPRRPPSQRPPRGLRASDRPED